MKENSDKEISNNLRISGFVSFISITLALFTTGLTFILLYNASKIKEETKKNIKISLFIKDNTKLNDIIRLQKNLFIKSYAEDAKIITKEQASRIMEKELGEDFVNDLGYNPLPYSVELKIKAAYANEDSIRKIKEDITEYEFISDFYYQNSMIESLNRNIRRISLVGTLLFSLLLLISLALINNTIRLSVNKKKFEIRTAFLVGADIKFIKKPFIINSLVIGLLSASVASLLLLFPVFSFRDELNNIVQISGIPLIIFLIFVIGVVITGISGNFAVNRFLNISDNKFYTES